MLKDLFIISQIKKGDIKAFEQLFRQYYSPLCLYAMSIVGEREGAEEIIEELFYTIWRDRKKLGLFLSTQGYLYTSVCNRCMMYIRHRKMDSEVRKAMLQFMPEHAGSPEEEMECKELQAFVEACLQKMPERSRQVFQMHRNEGLKYAEIARVLGISVKMVEAAITKALNVLRKEIESYYNERP